MVGVVNVGWFVYITHDVVANDSAGLISQRIDTRHIVHVARIMMYQVVLYSVIMHAYMIPVPSPSKTDTRIGNIANLIVADVCFCHISCGNCHTAPVVVGDVME